MQSTASRAIKISPRGGQKRSILLHLTQNSLMSPPRRAEGACLCPKDKDMEGIACDAPALARARFSRGRGNERLPHAGQKNCIFLPHPTQIPLISPHGGRRCDRAARGDRIYAVCRVGHVTPRARLGCRGGKCAERIGQILTERGKKRGQKEEALCWTRTERHMSHVLLAPAPLRSHGLERNEGGDTLYQQTCRFAASLSAALCATDS